MAVAGIYPVGERGPQLSETESALLASLPDQARTSRPATHAELRTAIMQMAERQDYTLVIEMTETGFVAVVEGTLRVIANQRGTGEETFYCQGESDALLRQLAEEIARACGPQLLLPVDGDDGVLVVAS
jgi:hypothetical protein